MSKSQVMCVGCDNPAGKQDAESDGFCEECIAFATDRVTPVAAQAGDFDPAPKYEYSQDGKTVKWTNRDRMPKVAAQAGDESMRAIPVKRTANGFVVHHRLETLVREYGTLDLRSQRRRDCMAEIYEIAAAQVSPRATADVERESANALLEELLILEAQENIARSDGNGEGITTKRLDSLTARVAQYLATTKPGA